MQKLYLPNSNKQNLAGSYQGNIPIQDIQVDLNKLECHGKVNLFQ